MVTSMAVCMVVYGCMYWLTLLDTTQALCVTMYGCTLYCYPTTVNYLLEVLPQGIGSSHEVGLGLPSINEYLH